MWLALASFAVLAGAGGGYWYYKNRGASPQVVATEQASGSQDPESTSAASEPESEPEGDVLDVSPAPEAIEPASPAQSQVGDAPSVQVGDRWITEVVDHQDAALSYRAERTVTDVGPDRIFTTVRTLGKDYVRVVEYTGEWALVATHLRSGATTTYSPALPYLSFPLQAGRSWEARVVETDAEGNQRMHEVRARTESWETVRVPAGTFTALKIVLADDISKDGVVIQQGQDVSWYAPEVRRTVKTEESSFDPSTGERRQRTVSLVEYSLHGTEDGGRIAAPQTAEPLAQSGLGAESVVGVWRYYEQVPYVPSIERYLRITAAGSGRFKLIEGVSRADSTGNTADGAVDWSKSSISTSDGIYLSESNGQLSAAFVSSNFRATHGQDHKYRLTITPGPSGQLNYTVWSSIDDKAASFEASRVSHQ